MSKTLIVDISHHQPSNKIDWEKAAKEVALFIIRVQYGSRTIDREYKNHVENCKKYGIPFAHYAYGCFVSVDDAKIEAIDFLKRIDQEAKFLVLDTENDTISACGTKDVAEASQTFIDLCRDAGYKTGFYVSHHLYKSHGLDKVNADFLWIPRYGINDGTPDKKPDYACDLWQYTEKGKVSWYGGFLDLNKTNGSKPLDWFIGGEVEKKEVKKEVKKATPKKQVKSSSYGVYTIERGDSLSVLAKKFKTTIKRLQDLNGIPNADKIFQGQKIKYDLKGSSATSQKKYYTIKSGDALSIIARNNGTSIKQLQSWNNIKDEDVIYAGQKIRVK